jgi:outer membrane protein
MTINAFFLRRPARLAAALTAAALVAVPLHAQRPDVVPPLTLADALKEADARAFTNRRAGAGADAAAARARGALAGVLPHLRVEGGAVRTTDPIGAFGSLLRQRRVTPAAFDPAALNAPAPITTVQSALVAELPLVNADAWAGRRAAQAAAGAAAADAAWSASGVRLDVIRAYFGAVVASAQVTVLEQASLAAAAAVRQVESMVREGMVTKADALQAGVRLAQLDAQLLGASNDALSAREGLALLLGRADGVLPAVPTTLPDAASVRALAAADTAAPITSGALALRGDVRAAGDGVRAADADAARALGGLLPRLNSFARYDWFTPGTLFGGQKNWTVGVMASWSAFGGGRELADRQVALAGQRAAHAGLDAMRAQGAQEIASARRGVVLALRQLDLATRAAAQGREAYRLVDKRYAGGLATIAERLGAESAATATALGETAALQQLIAAVALHRRTTGRDAGALVALDQAR